MADIFHIMGQIKPFSKKNMLCKQYKNLWIFTEK